MTTATSPPSAPHKFIYAFKIEDAIPNSLALAECDRISAESHIVSVIYESFVVTGDQDYLAARILAQSGLYRAFFWAAAQTIEKQLKAFLLLNGQSVAERRSTSHAVKNLFEQACRFDASLASMALEPHGTIQVFDAAKPHLSIFAVDSFLSDIDKYGRPDNRYNSFGIDYNTGHLFALDHLVFNLREKLAVPDVWQSLEKVDVDLQLLLEKNNPWFSRNASLVAPELPLAITSAVTKLDFLLKQKDVPAHRMALQWLNQKMKVPTEVQALFPRK